MKSIVIILAFLLGTFSNVLAGGPAKEGDKFDPTGPVMHHISDAHQFHLYGDVYLPLPCMAYSTDGFFFSMSSAFDYSHDLGHSKKAIGGYMIYHDQLMRIKGDDFPKEDVKITVTHIEKSDQTLDKNGLKETKGVDAAYTGPAVVLENGKTYQLEAASALQGTTSWHDFSVTKNIFTMLMGFLILMILLGSVAKSYKRREGQAPKGLQSLLEPVILFIRDEVVKPGIGPKWEKYFPFIMCLFFFILINNLVGLIPFFPGSANVTGNIGVTMVLAVFTFIVVNLSGNKHYWEHVLWMPGVPLLLKPLLTILEVVGLFIKPATLLIRLFANITAGHIMILSLTSLIFVFSNQGESIAGAFGGGAIAIPFVFVMNFLELFVAFLQAFIFALLASLYIGGAVEEHHHEEAHH
ncbi:MAG: F0F1 ATP synthase subunit A [Saprospiraceae bacterium]|nr:F0F1 ATP synthase subunit A [Saprospiraceae bacterium]